MAETTAASSGQDLPVASVIESVVFASGKPLAVSRLAKIVGTSVSNAETVLSALEKEYAEMQRGLRLVRKGTTVQMVTAPENAKTVGKLFQKETAEKLSDVALETLAIVAYRGPVVRADIEAVRGVNCTYILRNLLLRGLIERNEPAKGTRQGTYEISVELLRHLGVHSVKDLPSFDDLSEGIARVEKASVETVPTS